MLPTRDAACTTQCIPRWLYIENFWETRQKRRKKSRQVIKYCHWTIGAQSRILQAQMHSKSRKSAPNFENKRWHLMQRNKKNGGSLLTFWPSSLNAVTLLTEQPVCNGLKSLKWQQVQQCGFPFWISAISDKISQKINPQKSSKDFDVQNPERSSAMYKTQKDLQQWSHHAPPQTPKCPAGFSFKSAQVWENFHKTGATTRSIGLRSTKR